MEVNFQAPKSDDAKGIARALRGIASKLVTYFGRIQPSTVAIGVAASPDTPFKIDHQLRAVPSTFTPSLQRDSRVWATAADRRLWTSEHIYVRASVAGKVEVVVYE
jgi:hypothetical protein